MVQATPTATTSSRKRIRLNRRQRQPDPEEQGPLSALILRLPVWLVSVTDGDTVIAIVKGGETPFKVRLHGIDAPELDQMYGEESKNALAAMVEGKEIFVDIRCVDRYGRQVGVLHDGRPKQSFNRQLVEAGWLTTGLVMGNCMAATTHNSGQGSGERESGPASVGKLGPGVIGAEEI